MVSDLDFTKFFIGEQEQDEACAELLSLLEARCTENGLEAVGHADRAHFVFMVIAGTPRWLHFSSKGHFLPVNTTDYQPVVPELSKWRPSITCRAQEPDSYVLRQYREGEMTAAYANLNNGNRFDSMAAAEMWVPVYEDWMDLLSPSVTPDQFYATLPAPVTESAGTPTWAAMPTALPKAFADLFNWDERLNRATVNVSVSNGPGYRSEAGDYECGHFRTLIRCYAHPTLPGQYSRHWEE